MANIEIELKRDPNKAGGSAAVWLDVDGDGNSSGSELTPLDASNNFKATVDVPDPTTGKQGALFCQFNPYETVAVTLTGRASPKSLVMDGQGRNIWLITLA